MVRKNDRSMYERRVEIHQRGFRRAFALPYHEGSAKSGKFTKEDVEEVHS